MPERITKSKVVYEVLQNGVVVCSRMMHLTKYQAENKCENERRMDRPGAWTTRRVSVTEERP